MGELFVFLFFGLVAVNGSYFVQLEELDWLPFLLSISIGFLSTAILVVNNIRDIDTDRRAGKRTLAVKLGRERTRKLFVGMIVLALLVPLALVADGYEWVALSLLAAPLAIPLIRTVQTRTDGQALNSSLAASGRLLAVHSLLLSAGVLLS